MKQEKKFVLVLLFVFVGVLALLGITANVSAGSQGSTSFPISRQAVLRLIDHFAEPECAEAADNSQPKSTTFEHPVPECWLVSEARTVLGNHGRSEE